MKIRFILSFNIAVHRRKPKDHNFSFLYTVTLTVLLLDFFSFHPCLLAKGCSPLVLGFPMYHKTVEKSGRE